MKTSVISEEFRQRYLCNPADPDAFEGPAVVFDGPEDYHARIDDPALGIDESTLLFMRGAGPIGYPGAAEVVNMRPPAYLIKRGITSLPCIGDGRQSGTSGLALHPERLARSGRRRRTCAAEDRRPRAHRPAQGHRQHSHLRQRAGRARDARSRPPAATSSPPRRLRGRRSSARWSTSWAPAWCSSRR